MGKKTKVLTNCKNALIILNHYQCILKNPESPTTEVIPKIDASHMIMARILMVSTMNRLFHRKMDQFDFDGLPEYARLESGEKNAVIFHFKYLRAKMETIFSIRLELDDSGEPIFEMSRDVDWARKNIKRVEREELERARAQKPDLN